MFNACIDLQKEKLNKDILLKRISEKLAEKGAEELK